MDAIRMNGLTKYYGRTRGVERIDLSVERGDFFGLIGPNGAGKSTVIRTLLGLVRPSGGRAEIFGLDIVKDRKKVLERVGYLPAETALYPGMRVRDVLRLSAGLRKKDCGRAADQLCGRLLLDASRKVDELSFGSRKKVAIVCALQHEPELLVLDEPTVGLDPLMQREFFKILQERRERGTTIFLSSHILSEVRHNCAHAAILRDGSVAAGGSVEDMVVRAGAKRVRVRGRVDLGLLRGVRDEHVTPEGADFLYGGDMPALLAALAGGDVRDLTISEPDLEEVFLHYYGKEGEV